MYNNIFDSHAHYDDESFNEDRDSLLESMSSQGVSGIVNCATDIASCKKCAEMSDKYENIYFAAGIHPHEAQSVEADYIERLEEWAKHGKCVAIGEIGLDYHYDFSPREIQQEVFEAQLLLAQKLRLPVIIHDREAHEDTMNLLKKYSPQGIVHCFSGSVEMAREIVKLGMHIGLGGAVTFKNAKKPVEVAKYVPLEMLVLETDCPYMTPVPFRGKRNDSSLISYTADFIAQLKGISTQALIDITTENSKRIFGINE